MAEPKFYVGDKVELVDERCGIVRYIGKPHFSRKTVRYGIELDRSFVKGHDGSVGSRKYFDCRYGFGTFVKRDEIARLVERGDEGTLKNISFRIGDLVQLRGELGLQGYVRYIGPTRMVKGVLVGVELTEPNYDVGLPAGRWGGAEYFDVTEPHTAYFARIPDVIEIVTPAKKLAKLAGKMKMPEVIEEDLEITSSAISDQKLTIGDKVKLTDGRTAVVTSIDEVGQIAVDLDETDSGEVGSSASDGSLLAKRTVYINRESVIAVDGLAAMVAAEMTLKQRGSVDTPIPEEEEESSDEKEITLEHGDYVTLSGPEKEKGLIMFVGEVDFAKGEWIGLEMDNWSADGHDGDFRGKRYFRCKSGRGRFVRPSKIVDKLFIPEVLKSKVKDPRKLKRDAAGKEVDVYVVLKEMELKELDKLAAIALKEGLKNLSLGDRVELDGRTGTVRFIGKVTFGVPGESVGVELDKFFSQANDGKGYFFAKMGHGYFVSRTDITRVFPRVEGAEDMDEEEALIASLRSSGNMHLMDRVRISGGRTGLVRYIGKCDKKNPDVELIGLELDQPDPTATSGEYAIGGKEIV